MITIETYTNATDAYQAKGLLESNGIPCTLRTDTLSADHLELLVAAKDAKLARDVLANAIQE